VCSKYWFRPDAVTSPHELIIGSGFDGTGLHVLAEALRILGKAKVAYPAFKCQRCTNQAPDSGCDDSDFKVFENGLQGDGYGPDQWESTDAVMGHPVPLFTWDFLEAFPSAKVILTVRDSEDAWDTVSAVSPELGTSHEGDSSAIASNRLKPWVWGMPGDGQRQLSLDRRVYFRRLWKHNSKIIHGVPRQQLLVWNLYDNPSWEPLCEFLGVPVPDVPFPTPQKDKL
jgi:hypothetical protein